MQPLDPHQRPPEGIRNIYKKYQKGKSGHLDQDQDIVDLSNDLQQSSSSKVRVVRCLDNDALANTFRAFAGEDAHLQGCAPATSIPVYEHEDMPGKAKNDPSSNI